MGGTSISASGEKAGSPREGHRVQKQGVGRGNLAREQQQKQAKSKSLRRETDVFTGHQWPCSVREINSAHRGGKCGPPHSEKKGDGTLGTEYSIAKK